MCWVRTKGENFKKYKILFNQDFVILSRAKSSKQKELKYGLKTFQCTPAYSAFSKEDNSGPQFCLLLISAP